MSTFPESSPAPVRPLLPWQAALLGAVVGLWSSRVMESGTDPPNWMFALLVGVWFVALGLVYHDTRLKRWWVVALGGVLMLLTLGMLALSQQVSASLMLTVGLGLACLLLISGLERILEAKFGWTVQAGVLPAFVIHLLVTFGLASLLTMLFGGLLLLATLLLDAVGLEQPKRWLSESIVYMPLFLGTGAFFVGLLRVQSWGQTLTRQLSQLVGYLLPVALVIVVGFLLLLPLAASRDLEQLYQGVLNSSLYLSLTLFTLLLVLAAFDQPSQWPVRLQSWLRYGIFVLPLYPVLALYGLWKRIAQYGLTEERVLMVALAAWLLTTAVALARTRLRPAFAGLEQAVLISLLGGLGVAALLHMPGLRPVELGVRSQLQRLRAPALTATQALGPVRYLAYESGALGKARLKAFEAAAPVSLQPLITRALSKKPWEFESQQRASPPELVLKLLPGSALLSGERQERILSRLRPQKPDRWNCPTGASCELQGFAFTSAKGQKVLVLDRYSTGRAGQWFEFDTTGQLLGQGRFTELRDAFKQADGLPDRSDQLYDAQKWQETELKLRAVRLGKRTIIFEQAP